MKMLTHLKRYMFMALKRLFRKLQNFLFLSKISSFTILFCVCPFHSKYCAENRCRAVFLMSDNEFSGIIYSLLRGRQTIFLTIFNTKFIVKCATKILKIG